MSDVNIITLDEANLKKVNDMLEEIAKAVSNVKVDFSGFGKEIDEKLTGSIKLAVGAFDDGKSMG